MTPQAIAAELRTLATAAQTGLDNEHRDRQILLETLIDGVDRLAARIDTTAGGIPSCPRCKHLTAVHTDLGCRGCDCPLYPKAIASLAQLAARRTAQSTGEPR